MVKRLGRDARRADPGRPAETGEQLGLRERKRRRTHDALSAAAISLFLERGYDRVSVADIAAAAEVSKPTLFKYFASKEDLVLHRILDHRGEAARVVRHREPGETPLAALHRHFRAGLDRRDPVTGLNDDKEVLAFHRMVFETPSLAARLAQHAAHDEDALAAALAESDPSDGRGPDRDGPAGAVETTELRAGGTAAETGVRLTRREPGSGTAHLTARLAAAQIIATQRVLARDNWRELSLGRSADEVYPDAVAAADHAFHLLRTGLAGPSGG